MTCTPRLGASLARVVCVLVLGVIGASGCISLLPKTTPAQLYRFGASEMPTTTPAAAQSSGSGGRVTVLLEAATLPRAAANDGLLTVSGDQVAYISGARWASPAVLLFDEAAQRAFDARSTRSRLTARGDGGRVQATLRLGVRDFQVDYGPGGARGAPAVLVALHARLARADGTTLAEQDFAARKPAAEDRLSAIVPAYDAAVGEVLAQVVTWTDANLPPST